VPPAPSTPQEEQRARVARELLAEGSVRAFAESRGEKENQTRSYLRTVGVDPSETFRLYGPRKRRAGMKS